MKNCAIYTRTAIVDDLANLHQRLSAEKYLIGKGREGWGLCEVYEDNGVAGDTTKRPALQRLMRDIKAGEVDIVIVQGVDRLSRSALTFCEITQFLNDYNVPLVSVKQGCGTDTDVGRLVLFLMEAFAQYEDELERKAA